VRNSGPSSPTSWRGSDRALPPLHRRGRVGVSRAPSPAVTGPLWRRLLRRLLWRRAPKATTADVAEMRWYRDAESQQGVQPGPYCAIDAGPCGWC
jgi:hypothetical protein